MAEGTRRQAEDLFQQAADLPRAQRDGFLRQRCGSNTDLHAHVEKLLRIYEGGTPGFLRTLTHATDADPLLDEPGPPKRVGHYVIVRKIGQGGMGVVYEAQQEHPRRTVALKVLRAGLLSGSLVRRFHHEAEILGQLQHPGIAQIYEAGVAEMDASPLPFFAMELVHGQTLTDYAATHGLNPRERLELMTKVCDAVQHAHAKGVIHRDLKPANILVVDGSGIRDQGSETATASVVPVPGSLIPVPSSAQPKILDFGVARLTDSDVQLTTLQTDLGQLIGTVPYMSPEQVIADPTQVDTRSDIYALGVVLYELLSGRLPLDVRNRSIPEAARIIREDEPSRLSALNPVFRGDVETIVGKALEKEKARRYASASELAADIRRYLRDEPIVARAGSTIYHFRKFARRNQGLVVGLSLTMVALVLGTIFATTYWLREKQQRRVAEEQRDRARLAQGLADERRAEAEAVTGFLTRTLEAVDPAQSEGREVTVAEMLNRAAVQVDTGFRDQPRVAATLQATIGNTFRTLGKYPEARTHLEAALELRRQTPGVDELEIASTLRDLSTVLDRAGDYPQAEALLREALTVKKNRLGAGHREVAEILSNLGEVLYDRRDYAAAEPLCREALAIFLREYGEEHPDVASVMNNMAALLHDRGDPTAAEPYYQRTLAIRRKILSSDHPELARILNNYGVSLRDQGRFDEAEPLLREALAICRKIYQTSGTHDDLAMALHNLGVLLSEGRGDLAGAEPLMLEALDIFRERLGSEHLAYGKCLHDMGTLMFRNQDPAGAESYFRQALAVRRKQGGEDSGLGMTLNNLAFLLKNRAEYDEAEASFREALTIWRDVHGDEHELVAMARLNLGDVLELKDNPQASEPLYAESLRIRRKLSGDEHWRTADSLGHHGACLVRLGQFEAAEPELLAAQRVWQTAVGPDHPRAQRAAEDLVKLYQAWDKPEIAAQYQQQLAPASRSSATP